jgi:hypothetical protein
VSDPIFGDVIHSYTRAQALADGVLVDVSKEATEAGIKYPVAVTQRVHAELITPDPRSVPYGQSVAGRLWDTVFMLSMAIRAARQGQTEILYKVIYVLKEKQRKMLTLKAHLGGGDAGEPVITIMFPEED